MVILSAVEGPGENLAGEVRFQFAEAKLKTPTKNYHFFLFLPSEVKGFIDGKRKIERVLHSHKPFGRAKEMKGMGKTTIHKLHFFSDKN